MPMKILFVDFFSTSPHISNDNCIPALFNALKDEHDCKYVNVQNAITVSGKQIPLDAYRFFEIDRTLIMKEYLLKYLKLFPQDLIISNELSLAFTNIPNVITIAQNPYNDMAEIMSKHGYNVLNDYELKLYAHMQEQQFKNSTKIVAINTYLKNYAYKMNGGVVGLIDYGADTELFKPLENRNELKQKYGIPSDKKVGIWTGKFVPRDNFETVSQMVKEFKDVFWILVFKDGTTIAPKLPNVMITDYNTSNMPELYNCSDFYFNCSFIENHLLDALNAASCNIPIVVPKTGFFQDAQSGEIGEIIVNPTLENYKKAVQDVLTNKIKAFEKNAIYRPRQVILEQCSMDQFKQKWLELIKTFEK